MSVWFIYVYMISEGHRNCTIGCVYVCVCVLCMYVCVCAHTCTCMCVCLSVVYGKSLFPEINFIILCFGAIYTEVWNNVRGIGIIYSYYSKIFPVSNITKSSILMIKSLNFHVSSGRRICNREGSKVSKQNPSCLSFHFMHISSNGWGSEDCLL